MIPHTIHFVWLNDDTPSAPAQLAVDSWAINAPQFAVQVWTRSAVAAQWGARMLGTDLTLAVLSDLLRVHIIHEFGGVYLDADIFATPGAGEYLADVCDRCRLFGAGFDGHQSLQVDTVPMGAEAGLPGFAALARRPEQFINSWNRYLATSTAPPTILPGCFWNADKNGPGVKAIHRRGLLREGQPRPPRRSPERPTLVIKGKAAAAAYEAAKSRAKVTLSGIADRTGIIPRVGNLAIEVGTHRGEFAEAILDRFPGKLVCVDPWAATVDDIADPYTNRDRDADKAATEARLSRFGERAEILRSRSLDAVNGFPDASIDFVYIDPNHYDIRNDLAVWWSKVKRGGIMAGHDVTGEWEPWVRPAVEEFAFWEKVTPMVTGDSPASWFFVKR